MLISLKISNIALIEDVEIQFNKGLNILSGETGAGKSIILDSIALISGEMGRTELIRTGEQEAKILAIFDIEGYDHFKSYLETLGINTSENLLVIERHIFKDKKPSLAFVNHSRILIGILKDIGQNLLDIHSQHENQDLFNSHKHLEILDRYQGLENLVKEYQQFFQEAIILKKEIQELKQKQENNKEKEQFYKYRLDELDNADLDEQEWEDLQTVINQIDQYKFLSEELTRIYHLLSIDEHSIHNQIQEVSYTLEKHILYQDKQDSSSEIKDYLEDIIVKLKEVTEFVRSKLSNLDISPEEIQEQYDRFQFLEEIQKKYSRNIKELISYKKELEELLHENNYIQDQINIIENKREDLKQELIKNALIISEKRQAGAKKLEELIKQELFDLHMFNTDFEIHFQHLVDPNGVVILNNGETVRLLKDGIEKIEFFVSFNKGEEKRPLSKVGSGGEIARLMLAVKKILHEISPITTQIFDEIDTGIGGETAFAVGSKLLEISTHRQVICITHLPQIAAMGELQYLVKKMTEGGRTQTTLSLLSYQERVNEISRMLSGETLSPVSIEHAKELLNYKNTKFKTP